MYLQVVALLTLIFVICVILGLIKNLMNNIINVIVHQFLLGEVELEPGLELRVRDVEIPFWKPPGQEEFCISW